jgi:hypothetical protein
VAGKLDCGRGEARSYGTLSRKLRRDPTRDEGLLFDTAKRIWFNHFRVIPLAGSFAMPSYSLETYSYPGSQSSFEIACTSSSCSS